MQLYVETKEVFYERVTRTIKNLDMAQCLSMSRKNSLSKQRISRKNIEVLKIMIDEVFSEFCDKCVGNMPTFSIQETNKLLKRLPERNFDTRSFLKLDDCKKAFEKGFQDKLYTIEELLKQQWFKYSCVGVLGKDGFVIIDVDNLEMAAILRKIIRFDNSFGITIPKSWLIHYEKEKGQKIRELAIEVNGILKVSPVCDKQEKTVEGEKPHGNILHNRTNDSK